MFMFQPAYCMILLNQQMKNSSTIISIIIIFQYITINKCIFIILHGWIILCTVKWNIYLSSLLYPNNLIYISRKILIYCRMHCEQADRQSWQQLKSKPVLVSVVTMEARAVVSYRLPNIDKSTGWKYASMMVIEFSLPYSSLKERYGLHELDVIAIVAQHPCQAWSPDLNKLSCNTKTVSLWS